MSTTLRINSAARNAVWSYARLAEPRFAGAPALVEAAAALSERFGWGPGGQVPMSG